MTTFKELNLNPKILSALDQKGYSIPTPIQEQAIPHILEGRDVLGIAQTGTGKTAAFSLPILHNLAKSNVKTKPNNMRTLILTPTRELASQIVDNIKFYSRELGYKTEVIFGGVSINNQIKTMRHGVDIVVSTPGRLLDLMNQGHIRYSQLEIFVLDEADRMLDMGFIKDVHKIIAKLPKERQTLFFSATLAKDVGVLANKLLSNPAKVEVTPQATTVEKIDQIVNLVEKGNKPLLLKSIIKQDPTNSILVFSRTKHGANRIVEFLDKNSIRSFAIHGNKSQSAREKALKSFRDGKVNVLIATDIAARGIDIPGITHVINYDIPNQPESYVHRIGRTARAGRNGIAISFCDSSERAFLKDVEKTINLKIKVDETHPYHGVKASAQGKSVMDRPRGPNTSRSKPRSEKGEREVSHFRKSRQRNSDGSVNDNYSKPKPSARKSGSSLGGSRDSSSGEKRSYSSSSSDQRSPRKPFQRDSSPRSGSGPREERSERREPNGNRDFKSDRSSGERRSAPSGERKPFSRDSNPRFGLGKPREERSDSKEANGNRGSRFSNNDDRESSRTGRPQRASFGDNKIKTPYSRKPNHSSSMKPKRR